ncbi:ABC transporter ATP-binding protein [Mycobacteroides abscessus subsp. bolletii]|uniref:ABC transporter ATP-binding protein/permease n=1 Tax=Mycobacteroides abscessus TaxID=36809 RepID=UPI0009292022|nr:ABC transporter ATP-binding protein/permease [Mycobacteroides abscessus]SHR14607.1 ABC transporter ATP-binding protein [Mycobacteroides abscessus subsp. bolletii]SHS74444.1 ABC transporter ATP-binding protein [Mycobacteroides abscessus subsp. bolletii]SHS87670.1 ABC transporter ATP-binding protein [Mycobacteroides abscessus subsp. bolletii]SHT56535.1 ABC transporter ATP-binding protein [Mycobacteroides abscessus subsp. bolletii]SHY49370.1 ABC transporter ATP-binding protein [Mycobacteroides
MVQPSLDWPGEPLRSLVWTLQAWAVTMLVFLAVAVIVARFTQWGQQFWRVNAPFFWGRGTWRTWALLAFVVWHTVYMARVAVIFTYQYKDLMNALQVGSEALVTHDSALLTDARQAFFTSFAISGVLVVLTVTYTVVDLFLRRVFAIRWRVWLNTRLVDDWMSQDAFYRNRFLDPPVENPDQRIQNDIETHTTKSVDLVLGAVNKTLLIVMFTGVLWQLSGPLLLWGFEIPRAMVFIAFVFSITVTVLAFWIGRPLVRLNFLNERYGASFRYALVRLRDSAERVAFYRGGERERRLLHSRFNEIIANMWRIVFAQLRLNGWNRGVGDVTTGMIPYIVQAPRFFAGQIKVGDLLQTVAAFGNVCGAMSFFRDSYDEFTVYRAALLRIDQMLDSDHRARDLPRIAVTDVDAALTLTDVGVRNLQGQDMITDLNLALTPGGSVVVKGPSGCGKTTLLRSLAQLWPQTSGSVARPDGWATLFLPQLPYLPLGNLRETIVYPLPVEEVSDEQLKQALRDVSLGHLTERLDQEADWAAVLSLGEQQRVSFVRVLLVRPTVVFLDESTSALDEGLEDAMYALVRARLPACVVVSVGHRSTIDRHHQSRLELTGTGGWELVAIPG